jgi:hypothetical protein
MIEYEVELTVKLHAKDREDAEVQAHYLTECLEVEAESVGRVHYRCPRALGPVKAEDA